MEQLSSAGGSEGVPCSLGCNKCFGVGGGKSIFGFLDKHQCFKSDVGSYRKPVKERSSGVV